MFEELREMNNLIREKQERIAELRAAMTSMSAPLGEKVQSSPTDRLSKLMCEVIILENEVDGMVDEYADLKAMITGEIFSLENEGWQDILYSHYVEFRPWGEIAEKNGVSLKTIHKRKDRALKKLRKRC